MATNPAFKSVNTRVLVDALQKETIARTEAHLVKIKTLSWRQQFLDPTSELIGELKASNALLDILMTGHGFLTNPTNDTAAGFEGAYSYLTGKGIAPGID